MPNPQTEDGYTKIANELLDALCKIRIPGQAAQVFLAILRKTYGYSKKRDCISLSQFESATGLAKNKLCDALNKLEEMNLIIITEKGYKIAKTYEINKDYASWRPLPKKVTLPKKGIVVTEKGNNHTRKRVPQKKVTKESITKESIYVFFDEFWSEYPKRNGKKNKKKHAREKFIALCKKGIDPEMLIAKIKEHRHALGDFAPDAVVWLNGERWNDEVGEREETWDEMLIRLKKEEQEQLEANNA